MPEERNRVIGTVAEKRAARKYGLERVGKEWYDAIYPNGTKVQIKATALEYESGRTGRFYFWKRDHDKIIEANGGYIGVVYHHDPEVPASKIPEHFQVHRILKISPSKVGEKANWSPSGHVKGKQFKLPWDRV